MAKDGEITEEKKDLVNLDKILMEEVGPCGRFQINVIILCCVVSTFFGKSTNLYLFTFTQINTRCVIPECEDISTAPVNFNPPWIHDVIPMLASGSGFDNCHRFAVNSTSNSSSESCSSDFVDRNTFKKCEEFVYEDTNSAVFEYNLACDDWSPYLVGFIGVLGLMISLPISGFIADHWGRRVAVALTSFNLAWIGILLYFAQSYMSFFLLWFAQSIFGAASYSCAYILAIEYVGPKYRMMAGSMVAILSNIGRISLSLMAWSGIYWRYLILAIQVPSLVTVACFWIAPESARWLTSKGRYEEARDILIKAAEINGNTISETTLKGFVEAKNKSKEGNNDKSEPWLVCLVFKHPTILFRCLMISIWWMTSLLVFHGLIISTVAVSGNRYLNYCAASTMSMLGYVAAVVLVNIPRKPLLITGFWICGVCQCAYIFIPAEHYWLSMSVYMTGTFFIALSVQVVYVYTAELYPTRYRSSLFSFSSSVGRLGNLVAPLAPAIAAEVWIHLPYVLFGGMAFISGLLVLLAPETSGTTLPNTMEEAVQLGKNTDSFWEGFLRKKCYNVN